MATFPQDRYINRIRDPTFRVGAEATSVYIYIYTRNQFPIDWCPRSSVALTEFGKVRPRFNDLSTKSNDTLPLYRRVYKSLNGNRISRFVVN